MSYLTAGGRVARGDNLSIASGVVVTPASVGTTLGSVIETADKSTLRLTVVGSAFGGTSTPKVRVAVETSPTGVDGTWQVAVGARYAQTTNPWAELEFTANGTQRLIAVGLDRFCRVSCSSTSGTTPTLTIAVTGEAV